MLVAYQIGDAVAALLLHLFERSCLTSSERHRTDHQDRDSSCLRAMLSLLAKPLAFTIA
jgi:hypothetical protein